MYSEPKEIADVNNSTNLFLRGHLLLYFDSKYAFVNLIKKKEMDLICQYFGFDYGELADDMREKYFNYYVSYAFETILYFNSFNCPENVTKIDLCIFPRKR